MIGLVVAGLGSLCCYCQILSFASSNALSLGKFTYFCFGDEA